MKKTAEECSKEYFEGDELAAKVFLSKYAGEDEKTPDNMHQRIAFNVSEIERKFKKELTDKRINIDKLSDLGQEYLQELCESNDYQIRDKWFNLFKHFKYIVPGGSIMASLGNTNNVSLANCFVIDGPKDKMGEIMDKGKEMSYLFMRRGGVGTHLDYLRPNGALVHNAAKTSSGAASFMEYYSTTVKTVGQFGRRGALMLCMSDKHPDIVEFITMKQDLSKVTGANVSVKISKDLIKAYKNNEDWLLKWPIDSNIENFVDWKSQDYEYNKLYPINDHKAYFKKIKAKELFDLIITSAWKTAEPGILLWDNILDYDPASVYPKLKAVSTNPCCTGDTIILTDQGYLRIDSLVGKKVNVWNGYEWSEVEPRVTGTNQEILKIKFSDGNELRVTQYHKFILKDKTRIEAKDLKIGDSLVEWINPHTKMIVDSVSVISIEKQDHLEDKVYCFTEYKNHSGIFNGIITAQCGEQPLADADSCRLSHVNLKSFVKNPFTPEAIFDYELFRKVVYNQVVFLDDIIELEINNVQNIINNSDADSEKELWTRVLNIAKNGRRIGCGFTALGDTIAAMNLSFKDSHYLVESIMETKFKTELEASIDLAYLRGTFLNYDYNIEYPEDKPGNEWYQFLLENYPKITARMKELGRRNVSLSTVAPVGSGSLMTQTTSGIEPIFKTLYDRRVKVNTFDESYDFVDPNTKEKFKVFTVAHKGFEEYCEVISGKKFKDLSKSMINTLFKSSSYYGNEAADIPWETRLEIQSIVQKYTTSSISTTINLAADTPKEVVENIYLNADKMKLKGTTIYRESSRSGVLVSTETKSSDPSRKAPKRPSELFCHIHNMRVQGKNYLCALGFYEGKPYEIFVCPTPEDMKLPDVGKIVKIKKSYYQLQTQEGKVIVDNFIDVMDDQLEMITRILSIAIRSDVGFNFLIDQLKKSKGDLTAFHKVLARTIAKYVENKAKSGENCPVCGEKLVFQEGCLVCQSCSYSHCG